jgi:shikimate kinase
VNIVLIGLRGSGKTTVGRLLAERLRRPLVDLDTATARLLGATRVADAWARAGEQGFRQAESRALAAALAGDGQVIALGGGTPTAPGAVDLLRAACDAGRAMVVYLSAEAGTLRTRLAAADMADRPSLTGADPLAEIDAVFARRDPVYRELATEVLETDGLTVEAVVNRLADIAVDAGGR